MLSKDPQDILPITLFFQAFHGLLMKMNSGIFKIGLWSLIAIALDQISKYFIFKFVPFNIRILGDLLRIEYTQNTGIAFGIPIPYTILVIGNILLIGVIIRLIIKEFDIDQPITKAALILIISGAFGNIIDRLVHGFVIDFIAIWLWPNFNFADAYISIGILLMLVFYGRMRRSRV